MVKTKRELILATCFLSSIAAIISLVSVATEQWVVSDAMYTDLSASKDTLHIEYGLFKGTLKRQYPNIDTLEVTMTCLLDKNVCAVLCAKNGEDREDILKKLYNNQNVSDANVSECPRVSRAFSVQNRPLSTPRTVPDNKKFINAGVRISTLLFIFLSAILGIASAGIALWNAASNPIEIYFSIIGLYVYNGLAFLFTLIYIILWGVMFAVVTIYDVGMQYTLSGMATSEGRATLGYSYWINLVSLIFYLGSITTLYVRDYLISKEPEVNVHFEDSADPAILIY